jgi:glycine oxidase
MPKRRVPEVVVVGGGVTGAFAAYFLAERGVAVTLVERGEIAAEASGNNAGNLAPLEGPGIPGPMQALALESYDLHLRHAEPICELSRQDVAPQQTARIHLARDRQDRSRLRQLEQTYAAAGGRFGASWLDRDALAAAEPRLNPEFEEGLAMEGNARVDGGPYTRAIAAAAEALGAQVLKADVRGLNHRGGRVTGLDLASGTLDCGGVIVATGAWCAGPSEWLGVPIPVQPLKGQLVLAELPGGPLPFDVAWRDAAIYGTGGNAVWLGSTEEAVGFDRATTRAARALILERAAMLASDVLGARVVGEKAGLRPVTADGFPIVGRPDGWENICLAVGAGRKGMLLGAAIGLAAADSIVDGTTAVPVGFCAPQRWRDGRAA